MRPRGSALELEHRRHLAIDRLQEGYSVQEVAEFFGVGLSSVRHWAAAYTQRGESGIAAHDVPGRPTHLSSTQEKIVSRWLRDEKPTIFGFDTELWTAPRLAQLIQEEFRVHFNPDYLTHWLRDRGFTPQIPEKVPKERDPEAIAAWVKKDWPRIKQNAARKRAYIALLDESGVLMTPLLKRSWAPRGQRPVIHHPASRGKVSIAGALVVALTHRRDRLGLFFSTLINDYFTNFSVAAFIESLLKSLRHPVIVVWDRGPNHAGDPIRELQRDYKQDLMLEKLPPYAPMLNPVESVWGWLKYGRLSNFSPHDPWEAAKRVTHELSSIQSDQTVLRNLFRKSDLPMPRPLLS